MRANPVGAWAGGFGIAGAATSLTLPIAGVIVLDIGVRSGLVSTQARAFAVGAAVSDWLTSRPGWTGVVRVAPTRPYVFADRAVSIGKLRLL